MTTYLDTDLDLKFFVLLDRVADLLDQLLVNHVQGEWTFPVVDETISTNYIKVRETYELNRHLFRS